MKKMFYKKNLQGVTEFSFEELRAIKYRRKRAEQESKKMEEEKLRWKEEQNELLRKQVLHHNFGKLGSRLEVLPRGDY